MVVGAGVNIVKRHQKSRPTGGRSRAQGGIIEFEAPIRVSKVMLVETSSGEKTRVGVRRDENGRPVRYSKKSGAELD